MGLGSENTEQWHRELHSNHSALESQIRFLVYTGVTVFHILYIYIQRSCIIMLKCRYPEHHYCFFIVCMWVHGRMRAYM